MPYLEMPAMEQVSGNLAGQANGAVTQYTFCSIDGDAEIATATSGFAGICTDTAADNVQTGLKVYGIYRLAVNGNSVNIAAMDPLKPTTGGLGVKAATDKDKYSAIALEASTTDGDNIPVVLAHGFVSAT